MKKHRKILNREEEINALRSDTIELNENVIDLNSKVKELNDEIKFLIEENKNNYDRCETESISKFKYFFELYHEKATIKFKDNKPGPLNIKDEIFTIDMNNPTNREFVTGPYLSRLPNIKQVLLRSFQKEDPDIILFLKHLCPLNPQIFDIGYEIFDCYNIDYYLNALVVAVANMRGLISINRMSYSADSFERIIQACAKGTTLIIRHSKINGDRDFNFPEEDYKIEYFGLQLGGDCSEEGWSSNPEKLQRIIRAISKCNMKKSLRKINVFCGGVGIEIVRNYLDDFKLDLVDVVMEDRVPW